MSMTLSKKKFAAYILVAVVLSAVVAGTGVYYMFLPPTMQPTPTIVISVWGGPYYDGAKKVADAFTKATGIRTIVTEQTNVLSEVVPKIEASMPDPVIDVLYAGANHFPTLINKSLVVPIDESVVTNLADTPAVAKWVQDGKTYGVGLYSYGYVWAYNTNYVKQPITQLKDLMRPELKGKVAIQSPEYEVGLSVLYFSLAAGTDEHNSDQGFALLKQYAQAGVFGTIVHNDQDIVRVLTTGEAWVAMSLGPTFGAPVSHGVPLSPIKVMSDVNKVVMGWDGLTVINGPRKDLAMQYVKFALNPDNVAGFDDLVQSVPVNPNVKVLNESILQWNLSPQEVSQYGYLRDFAYDASHWDQWVTTFQEQITPLVKPSS